MPPKKFSIQGLIAAADRMEPGVAMHGPWLGLSNIPSERFHLATQRLREAETAFASALSTKVLSGKRVMLADNALKTWLTKARLVILLALGPRWSESWIQTGFTDRKTNIPKKLESRITLARALVSFFARHPEYGVAFAEVTAARGRAIHDRVVQSCEMLQVMENDLASAKQERVAADSALREIMGEVITGLLAAIDRSDPRWRDFGLKPKKISVQRCGGLGPAGKIALDPIAFLPAPVAESQKIAAA
jgi:hypothetical protein